MKTFRTFFFTFSFKFFFTFSSLVFFTFSSLVFFTFSSGLRFRKRHVFFFVFIRKGFRFRFRPRGLRFAREVWLGTLNPVSKRPMVVITLFRRFRWLPMLIWASFFYVFVSVFHVFVLQHGLQKRLQRPEDLSDENDKKTPWTFSCKTKS